ncbi:hypothetical protein [Roseovarius rhodophyticola]|uniref:Uncharacterized protein n=1 Tax=Roseovarius rhodophyticola TaxID=3080827 RepID=A0ABZ2TDC6_9RHOB
MPLQNRLQPTGDILAIPDRGTLMGNRGILHDDHQHLTARRWQHPHWVTCVTTYKDWHRKVMQPHNYTELFFSMNPQPWLLVTAPAAFAVIRIIPGSKHSLTPPTARTPLTRSTA